MRVKAWLLSAATGAAALTSCGSEDDCISQCESQAGDCVEQPLASFGDLEAGREEFRGRCDSGAIWAFEGVCDQGTVVLRSGTGYTSEGRFYRAQSGEFLGLASTTDVVDSQCQGKSFWPRRVPCSEPTITEVFCGTAFEVGQPAGQGVTQ